MRRALFLSLLLFAAAACDDAPTSGSTVMADGIRLYYRAVGYGSDTVIALHDGPGLHGGYLVDALRPLGSRATFLIYDLRGRGRSSPELDTATLSLERDAGDVESIREAHRLSRITLLGHGWGAGVAAEYARRSPERVARMLFVSPMFPRATHVFGVISLPYGSSDSLGLLGLDSARLAGVERSDPEGFCRRFWGAWLSPSAVRQARTLRRLAAPMCDAPSEALARVEAVNRSMMRGLGGWDWRGVLRDVHAPVLLIQGGLPTEVNRPSNVAVWRTAAREWTEALPNSGIVFLDAQPQFPWLDDPGGFARAASTFLAGNWPREVVASRSRS